MQLDNFSFLDSMSVQITRKQNIFLPWFVVSEKSLHKNQMRNDSEMCRFFICDFRMCQECRFESLEFSFVSGF
jgi:hypothetical protein